MPWELEGLWVHFQRLCGRRQAGMAANPFLPSEIESYARQALVQFTAWEFDLICRLDTTALAAVNGRAARATPTKPGDPIPFSNAKGIRALFDGLAVKVAQRFQKSEPEGGKNE